MKAQQSSQNRKESNETARPAPTPAATGSETELLLHTPLPLQASPCTHVSSLPADVKVVVGIGPKVSNSDLRERLLNLSFYYNFHDSSYLDIFHRILLLNSNNVGQDLSVIEVVHACVPKNISPSTTYSRWVIAVNSYFPLS